MVIRGATEEAEFWARASGMLQLAHEISDELARSDVLDIAKEQLRELVDSVPATPEPLSEMDPYLRDAMLTAVIHAMRAEKDNDRRELRIAVERLRQALRDVLDERPVWRSGAKNAAVWLRQQGLTIADLSELLGASETSVRRWTNPQDSTEPSDEYAVRATIIAKIVNHLRHAMTVKGVVQWLERPHPALDDRPPVDELKDPASYQRLVDLASGARSYVAT